MGAAPSLHAATIILGIRTKPRPVKLIQGEVKPSIDRQGASAP